MAQFWRHQPLLINDLDPLHNGSVTILWHFTSTEVRFLDLDFLRGAGGPGNPCYRFQARNCKFRTSLKCEFWKCESKATLPMCRLFCCIFCLPLIFHWSQDRNVFNRFAIPFLCLLNYSCSRYRRVLFFALFIDRRIFIFNLAALELSTAITVLFFLLVIQTITWFAVIL